MQERPHRKSWFGHQRFPAQALLLESHDAFLAAGEQFAQRLLRIASGQGLSPRQTLRFAGRLEEEFRSWQWSMSCHESYEESKLYPFLTLHFEVDCTELMADHARLHELGAACEKSLAQAAIDLRAGASDSFAVAHEQVQGYRAALARHLASEEVIVIPLLLSLSPEDFARYSGGETCKLRPEDEVLRRAIDGDPA